MTDVRPTVYRATRPVRIGGGDRVGGGDLVINPPAWATDSLSTHLERLDENGRIERSTLRSMQYHRLRRIAAEGDVDGVDGNSAPEDIIDAYALAEDDTDTDSDESED